MSKSSNSLLYVSFVRRCAKVHWFEKGRIEADFDAFGFMGGYYLTIVVQWDT